MKKYLKDYKLIPKMHNNGRIKEDVEYVGKYYTSAQSGEELHKRKILCLILSVSCVAILTLVGLMNTSGSRVFYIAVPYACLFLPSFFCVMGAVRSLGSGNRLEHAAYDKSVRRMFRSAVGMLVFGGIIVIGDLSFLLSGWNAVDKYNEILFLTGVAIVFLLCIMFLKNLKGIIYEEEDTNVS